MKGSEELGSDAVVAATVAVGGDGGDGGVFGGVGGFGGGGVIDDWIVPPTWLYPDWVVCAEATGAPMSAAVAAAAKTVFIRCICIGLPTIVRVSLLLSLCTGRTSMPLDSSSSMWSPRILLRNLKRRTTKTQV